MVNVRASGSDMHPSHYSLGAHTSQYDRSLRSHPARIHDHTIASRPNKGKDRMPVVRPVRFARCEPAAGVTQHCRFRW